MLKALVFQLFQLIEKYIPFKPLVSNANLHLYIPAGVEAGWSARLHPHNSSSASASLAPTTPWLLYPPGDTGAVNGEPPGQPLAIPPTALEARPGSE